MKKMLMTVMTLLVLAGNSPKLLAAPVLDLSPLVPVGLVTDLTSVAVGEALPVLAGLLLNNPLSEPLVNNFGMAKPLTDLLLGGDTLKGLTTLYGPLDAVLLPVVDVTAGLTSVLTGGQAGSPSGGIDAIPLGFLVDPVEILMSMSPNLAP
ncbi:hypothetical protein [Spongiibacter tropicus]|uniref:hypothetical protein n=1 Tax=Spongiibacter tropicus TaxID=454602 RepID=UPI0003B53831|nr:hypothetical protein [Spongiibacter tropicus]